MAGRDRGAVFEAVGTSAAGPDGSAGNNQTERALRYVGAAAVTSGVLGLVYALGLSGFGTAVRGAALAILAGLAAFLVGGVLGLIFGIPKSSAQLSSGGTPGTGGVAEESPDRRPMRSSRFEHNTNLEQISDWLTKMIVGIGLTQFRPILSWMGSVGAAVSEAVGGSGTGAAVGASMLVAAATGGFLLSYLWTRRYLMGEFARAAEDALHRELEKTREQVRVIAQAAQDGTVMPRPTVETDRESTSAGLMERLQAEMGDVPEALRFAQAPGDVDDPWKGRFGGVSSGNGFTLDATVTEVPGGSYYTVRLIVTKSGPRTGVARTVRFFLHPTFSQLSRVVRFGPRGVAEMTLLAWGAFTVGALCDDGTELELDLATLPSAPALFRSR